VRILFVIPHYYGSGATGYGATGQGSRTQRIMAVRTCILSLHQHLGAKQVVVPRSDQPLFPANQSTAHDIEVIVCVTGDDHLLDELEIPESLYTRHSVALDDPLQLGFCCYDVMRNHQGNHDWYCYLEDDLVISDPLFFHKLQSFYTSVGHDGYLLQPHRFEISSTPLAHKAYVDGPLWENNLMEDFAQMRPITGVSEICLDWLNMSWRLILATNPHSGGFFLMASQLEQMLRHPWCGKVDCSFCGHMESAASLYIMTFFNIYKPAPECASFLELHHYHQRYLPR
jgi:hypothetical protein